MTIASPRTTVVPVIPGRNDDPTTTTTTTTPNTAIDFRELRRSMRRARVSTAAAEGRGGGGGKDENMDGTTITTIGGDRAAAEERTTEGDDDYADDYGVEGPLPPVLDSSWSSSSSSDDDVPRRYRFGGVDHVHYVSKFLNHRYVDDVLLPWLQSRPDVIEDRHGSSSISSESSDGDRNNMRWKTLRHARRRVMMVDSTATATGDPDNSTTRMPEVLNRIVDALVETGFFPSSGPRPNHVLINEYRPGEGILPHTDGPAYHPRTATISISVGDGGEGDGSAASANDSSTVVTTGVLFKFRPRLSADEIGGDDDAADGQKKSNDAVMEVLLEGRGSLVVFSDDAYSKYCHSIEEVATEVATDGLCVNCDGGTVVTRADRRISLTFRHKYVR